MTVLRFVAVHYAALAALAACGQALGATLTARLRFASWLEEACFTTTLGLGVLGSLVFLLGVGGVLYWWSVAAVVTVILVAGHRRWLVSWARCAAGARRALSTNPALLAVAVVLAAPLLVLPLYPPWTWDSTSYHLAAAKIFATTHHVGVTPYLRYPVLPQLNEMLFTLALLFHDDVLAQLIQLVMMLLLAGSVVACGARYFSPRVGWWAAALLIGNPIVLFVATTAYVDAGTTLFTFTATYAWWNWRSTRATAAARSEQGWLTLSAVLTGFAVGSKYYALFFFVVLAIATAVAADPSRRWRDLARFLAIALTAGGPFYLRNAYYTGDPFFPMLPRVFGYSFWTAADMAGQLHDLQTSHGVGRGLGALLALPRYLFVHSERFGTEATLSPLTVLLAPFALAAAAWGRRGRFLAACALAYVLFWFYSAQILRYLLPALPFVALAIGAGLDGAIARWPSVRRRHATLVVVAGFALLIAPGVRYALQRLAQEAPLPVTPTARDEYLASRYGSYPAYRFLNAQDGGSNVYALYDENMAYFADGRFMGDWFGAARFGRIVDAFNDPVALTRELRALGADYLLINVPRFAEHQRHQLERAPDSWAAAGLETVYSAPSVLVVRVPRDPRR